MIKLNKKQAIGTKTDADAAVVEKRVYRDGHKHFTAPEAKAFFETVTAENRLREKYYKSKVYLKRDRNPLNGEYTPREEDLPNVSQHMILNEPQEWFSPEVPTEKPTNVEKDKLKRQLERTVQLKSVRDRYDKKLQDLQKLYGEKAKDVEQSLLLNRLGSE